jgi:hypothetical protein
MTALDAIVLAEDSLAETRIAGMTARARAERTAARAGARVLTIATAADRAAITTWRGDRTTPVLVIRADQLVHPPLVAPLLARTAPGVGIAVDPTTDRYAGALLAGGDAAAGVVAALARGASDIELAAEATWRVPHGHPARHPIATAAERRGARDLLFGLIAKPQDNAITRYLFRPVSGRISRLLVATPLTATHISLVVALLVAVGCWLTLDPRPSYMIAGALTILGATYLDCCDGEVARIKLQASTFGAWLDTVVDELSSIAYMIAIGWHCHAYYGRDYFGAWGFDPWLAGIWLGVVTYGWSLYGVYYNIIVGVGSANSQDYASRFVIRDGKLAPQPPGPARELPRWLTPIAEFLPNIVRRDFIVWLAALYAVARVPHLSFATHVAGGVVSSVVIAIDHLHLRKMRRALRAIRRA